MLLIGEIFDRLVVEQAIDRLGIGFAVAFVHLAAVLQAPVGDKEGEGHIGDDGAEGHRREGPLVEPPQDAADQRDLEHRRHEAEKEIVEQEFGAADAALDRARQAAGLALEMEAQRQQMQVLEGRERESAHRALADLGEDRIAQFGEALRPDARDAIGDDEHHRHADQRHLAGRERIDRVLVEHRHINGAGLRDDQQTDGDDDADAQLEGVARPEIGQQLGDSLQLFLEADLADLIDPAALTAAVPAHAAQPAFSPRVFSRCGSFAAIATTPAIIIAPI